MDNIDGKQARRTGQSSGLGELFEYGPSSYMTDGSSINNVVAMGSTL
jgi:hypothetical protein